MKITHKNIPHVKPDDKIILFDGECKLCNAWCRFIIKYDKNHIFKFSSMQSDKGQAILKYVKQPIKSFVTVLYIENNCTYVKSTAFLKIARLLPFPIKSLILFKYIPNIFRDFIYDRIALNRYKLFGKFDQCILPAADDTNRYL